MVGRLSVPLQGALLAWLTSDSESDPTRRLRAYNIDSLRLQIERLRGSDSVAKKAAVTELTGRLLSLWPAGFENIEPSWIDSILSRLPPGAACVLLAQLPLALDRSLFRRFSTDGAFKGSKVDVCRKERGQNRHLAAQLAQLMLRQLGLRKGVPLTWPNLPNEALARWYRMIGLQALAALAYPLGVALRNLLLEQLSEAERFEVTKLLEAQSAGSGSLPRLAWLRSVLPEQDGGSSRSLADKGAAALLSVACTHDELQTIVVRLPLEVGRTLRNEAAAIGPRQGTCETEKRFRREARAYLTALAGGVT